MSLPSFFGNSSPQTRLEPEYAEAYTAWRRDATPENTARLLKQLQPLINRTLRGHGGSNDVVLRGRAKRLVLKALETYDPRQSRLSTHLYGHLQGLHRAARATQNILPLPDRIAADRAYVQEQRNMLEEELGREPSLQELADYTGLSVDRLRHIARFQPGVAEGTLSVTGEEGSLFGGPAVRSADEGNLVLRAVYGDLDPINQKILEWSTGLYGGKMLPNAEIARRLRLTPGAISQRKAKIQQRIEEMRQMDFFAR